jgi:phosphatidylinositol alpha-1,6-mannosyltransferase
MERLNSHLVIELARFYEVTVIGPKGTIASGASRVLAAPSSRLPIFLLWAAWTSFTVAFRTRPRWILGGSGLVAPIVMFAAWTSRARSGLYLHGLDIVVKHPLYHAVWLPSIRRAHLCFVNSTNTRELAASAGVDGEKLEILFPGVQSGRPVGDAKYFRESLGISNGPILLSVGRLTARKGIAEFVDNALPGVVKHYPQARFVVIGDDAPDALLKGRENQRERILALAAARGVRDNVVLLGSVDDTVLSDAYAAADVHIFPVIEKHGDVEGFGMVAVEAAAAGIPTVAYAVGGVPDAVAPRRSGVLVPPGDYRAFSEAVLAELENGKEIGAGDRRRFADTFSWTRFGDRLRQIMVDRESAP